MVVRGGQKEPSESELLVRDLDAWSSWLAEPHSSDGVWLVLAKKGVTEPTRLTYDEALEEAICHGWIDGPAAQSRRADVLPALHTAAET